MATKIIKPKIYSRMDVMLKNRVTEPCPTGNGYEWIYREKRDPDTGEYIVYAAEMKCLNDEIQAAYDDTKIYNILERVTNGEVEAINRKIGRYADLSEVPTSVFELEEQIGHMKRLYTMADCSDKFSFNEFLEMAGTKDFREYFEKKLNVQNTQSGADDQKTAVVQNDGGNEK